MFARALKQAIFSGQFPSKFDFIPTLQFWTQYASPYLTESQLKRQPTWRQRGKKKNIFFSQFSSYTFNVIFYNSNQTKWVNKKAFNQQKAIKCVEIFNTAFLVQAFRLLYFVQIQMKWIYHIKRNLTEICQTFSLCWKSLSFIWNEM